MEKKLLEVGDVVYNYQRYGNGLTRHTIESVSPKQAKSRTLKMNREITFSYSDKDKTKPEVKAIGKYGSYSVETPKLLERWNNQQLINKAYTLHTNFSPDQITIENAQLIIDLYTKLISAKH